MNWRNAAVVVAGLLLAATSGVSLAQPTEARVGGEALFAARCKSCHEPPVTRAPSREQLRGRTNQEIMDALTSGVMQPMATGLSPADIAGLARFLTGRNVQA